MSKPGGNFGTFQVLGALERLPDRCLLPLSGDTPCTMRKGHTSAHAPGVLVYGITEWQDGDDGERLPDGRDFLPA